MVHTEAWRQEGTQILTGAQSGQQHVLNLWEALLRQPAQQQVHALPGAARGTTRCCTRQLCALTLYRLLAGTPLCDGDERVGDGVPLPLSPNSPILERGVLGSWPAGGGGWLVCVCVILAIRYSTGGPHWGGFLSLRFCITRPARVMWK